MPGVLADLSGATGDKVRRELPDPDLVRRIWNSVGDLNYAHGVSKGGHGEHRARELARNGLSIRRARFFRAISYGTEVLPAHNAKTVSFSKAQRRLGKLVNRVRCERYVDSLDQLAPQDDAAAGPG